MLRAMGGATDRVPFLLQLSIDSLSLTDEEPTMADVKKGNSPLSRGIV
jgi:hypothetical protein